MSSKVYGYVRVSTKGQNEDRQVIAMQNYGIADEQIVVEKQSGKDFDRPVYRRLLRRMRTGDTLVITSLDRLGRNYDEIQEQWRFISKERGIAIVVLDMPLLNTKENAELIGQFITDLVLQLLSFVAQTERESIRTRQREGIEAAKARGVRFGRPRLQLPEGFSSIVKKWREGAFTAQEAAQRLGFSRSTFFRRVRELEQQQSAACASGKLPLPARQVQPCTVDAHFTPSGCALFPLTPRLGANMDRLPEYHAADPIKSSPPNSRDLLCFFY